MTDTANEPTPVPTPDLTSPLCTTDPMAIEELFDRDPLSLTRSDRDTLVAELRKRRREWKLKEDEPKVKREPKAKATKPKLDKAAISNLTLADLFPT